MVIFGSFLLESGRLDLQSGGTIADIVKAVPETWVIHQHQHVPELYEAKFSQYVRRLARKGWYEAMRHIENKRYYSTGLVSIRELIKSIERLMPEDHPALPALVNDMSGWDMRQWHDVVERWHKAVLQHKAKDAGDNGVR